MKHVKIWIGLGLIVLALGITLVRKHTQSKLPAPDSAALSEPQTSIPDTTYNPTTPLSKPKTVTMNIEITKEGNGPAIKNGQTAVVSYIGKFENGTVFDSSIGQPPLRCSPDVKEGLCFVVGAGEVIKGWDQGVLGMQVGESRTLTIPSDLAYGPSGIPGVIPPNATLVFEVTLLAIK